MILVQKPKIYYGLAMGTWIVSHKWLEESLKKGEWQPEEAYDLVTKPQIGKSMRDFREKRRIGAATEFLHPQVKFTYILALPQCTGNELND